MKKLSFSKLVILIAVLVAGVNSAKAQFNYTGTIQTYTVPLGAFSVTLDVQGARGGHTSATSNPTTYANGGRVQCTLATTPGSILYIYVGGQGVIGNSCCNTSGPHAGGWNGGGIGYNYGGGGGGASDIRVGGTALSNRVVVAGGGGGFGGNACNSEYGGAGGGTTGGNGYYCGSYSSSYCGVGGTQSGGGAGPNGAGSGNLGIGGDGTVYYYGTGGGGGGYFGGSGTYYAGGGGGGSSYTDATLATVVTHTPNYYNSINNGQVFLTPNCVPPTGGNILVGPPLCAGTGGTFTNPTGSTGGTWSSLSPGLVSVNPVTGAFTTNINLPASYSQQLVTIVYDVNYSCGGATATKTLTINPIPIPPSGGTNSGLPTVCKGSTNVMSVIGGGTWTSSNTNIATMTNTATPGDAVLTGINAGTAVLTYKLPATGCSASITATVNPVPAVIQPAALKEACFDVPVTFSDANAGGTWGSSNTNITINSSGVLSYNSANINRVEDDYRIANITYKFATGCSVSKSFTVNPLPAPLPVSSDNAFRCSNAAPINITQASTVGYRYQLKNHGVPYGPSVVATDVNISYPVTDSGLYSITGTTDRGCVADMANTLQIQVGKAPKAFGTHLVGSPIFCDGLGPHIILDSSERRTNYIVSYLDKTPIAFQEGKDYYPYPIDFGQFNDTGRYIVYASDSVTSCQTIMGGAYTLTPQPYPQVDTLTGGGKYCPGGTGVRVTVKGTVVGIDYYLKIGGISTGIAYHGSGSSLDFGLQTRIDNYTAFAKNATTGCETDLYVPGSVDVALHPVPLIDSVVNDVPGGGAYCSGGGGVHITLKTTEASVKYQLYVTGTAIGIPIAGNGTSLDPGVQYAPGLYTAIATDTVTGCSSTLPGSALVTILPPPSPATVGGGGTYCNNKPVPPVTINPTEIGVKYRRLDMSGATVGLPINGDGGAMDFGPDPTLGTFTVVAEDNVSHCTALMPGSATVAVNTLPLQYAVTGGGNYCTGSGGVHIKLPFSALGVDYTPLLGGVPVGTTIPGSSAGIDFGIFTALGTYSIEAKNRTTGCTDTMSNTVTVTNSTPPSVFPVIASGSSYCAGDAGINITLAGSEANVKYQFLRGGLAVDTAQAGTGLGLDFGLQTLPGIYTVKATDGVSGCASTMFGSPSVSINALPTVYTVTGGGTYCTGTAGASVKLSNSQTAIYYQLYANGSPVGLPKIGTTGAMLDFGPQTIPGVYTVQATNPATVCPNSMSGSVTVSMKALPTPFDVTGGGDICAGSTGTTIGLSGSETGTTYQLYNGGTAVGLAQTGTNSSLSYGLQAVTGTYTVKATTTASGCTSTMNLNAVINLNPLPNKYTVYGGATFCAGGSSHVMLSTSEMGFNYQLMNGSTPVGMYVTGTGTVLDLGAQSASGTYKIISTDAITGCQETMTASAVIVANPLPALQTVTVTNGGHYCVSGSGVRIGIDGSVPGTKYQLYKGATPLGTALPGGGLGIDFGLYTATGTYTIMGIDPTTGCTQNMTGVADVVIDAIAPASVTLATPTSVCEGISQHFVPMPVKGGATPAYVWKVNGATKSYATDYTYVPVNGDIVSVQLTSSDACASPNKDVETVVMTVTSFQLPSASIAVAPGTELCTGTSAKYTATTTNGGDAPKMSWLKNNVIVASDVTTYEYTPANNDVVIFQLSSNYPCRLEDSVFSNALKMSVDAAVVPTVSITASRGTTLGLSQSDTFRAVVKNGGLAPRYQWSNNGHNIAGATTATYISNEFFNNDSLSCEVTNSNSCGLTSFSSIIISIKNLGAQQLMSKSTDIVVLPNPNTGEFTVKGQVMKGDVTIEVTNMLGQTIYSSKVAADNGSINERIKLGNTVANGMYLLNVRSAAGNNVYHVVVGK